MKTFFTAMAAVCLTVGAFGQTTTVPVTIQVPVVQGPQGLPGAPGTPGQNETCPTSSALNFAGRFFQENTPQLADTVTKAATMFGSAVPIPANTFKQVGQMFEVKAEIDLATGITGTPQIEFVLDNGTVLVPANGEYIGTATTQPWVYREDVWITVTAVGTSGSIRAQGAQTVQTSNVSPNQPNAVGAVSPETMAIPFDTTVAHTLGFGTGAYSFTGSVTQQSLFSLLWP